MNYHKEGKYILSHGRREERLSQMTARLLLQEHLGVLSAAELSPEEEDSVTARTAVQQGRQTLTSSQSHTSAASKQGPWEGPAAPVVPAPGSS